MRTMYEYCDVKEAKVLGVTKNCVNILLSDGTQAMIQHADFNACMRDIPGYFITASKPMNEMTVFTFLNRLKKAGPRNVGEKGEFHQYPNPLDYFQK